jgi:ribonucleoside-diphosphate reductase alpha chain
MIEDSVSNKNDYVITFCVQVPEFAVLKNEVSAIDFLNMVKSTYENWVVPGTARPDSAPGLNHNVSNTVTVKQNEWDEVTKFIYDNKECFSGISLIADFGEKVYAQAPFEKVETEDDIRKWNEIVSNYIPVDWSKLSEEDDFTEIQQTVECAGGACELK